MNKKYIIYALLALGLGGLVFNRIQTNKKADEKNNAKSGKPVSQVQGLIVQPKNFSDVLSLSGTIEANEKVDIRSEISGMVDAILFAEGSHVNAGQALIKINDSELRAQLAQAVSKRDLTSENERRAKLLLQKEAISQEEYDAASAEYRTAKAQIQLLQAQLTKTTVKAPFSGVVGLRNISKGAYVTATTEITKLVNASQVKITFSVPEKYATLMQLNTLIEFKVAGDTKNYQGKVYAIDPNIDVATRTLSVRAVAQNADGKLIPGTFANITFPLNSNPNTLMVPSQALIPVQNGKKLYISSNGKAKEIMVQTGSREVDDVVVLDGIKAGDTVLVGGIMSLRDGADVKVNVKK